MNRNASHVARIGGSTYTQIVHNVWDFTTPPLPPSSPLAPREDAGDGGIVFEFNGQQQLTNRYLNGPNANVNDQFFSTLAQEAVTSASAAGTVTYPLLDNEGSVRDMVDANGNLIDHVTYTVFGQIANETNPAAAHLASYAGGLLDSATGLLNEHHRWLVLSDHFWVSEDRLLFLDTQQTILASLAGGACTGASAKDIDWLVRVLRRFMGSLNNALNDRIMPSNDPVTGKPIVNPATGEPFTAEDIAQGYKDFEAGKVAGPWWRTALSSAMRAGNVTTGNDVLTPNPQEASAIVMATAHIYYDLQAALLFEGVGTDKIDMFHPQ